MVIKCNVVPADLTLGVHTVGLRIDRYIKKRFGTKSTQPTEGRRRQKQFVWHYNICVQIHISFCTLFRTFRITKRELNIRPQPRPLDLSTSRPLDL